jgi:hypothetical protein
MNNDAGEIASNLHPKVFVLRLWEEPQTAQTSVWRASIHHPNSGQRWHFSQPQQLTKFLTQAPRDMVLAAPTPEELVPNATPEPPS